MSPVDRPRVFLDIQIDAEDAGRLIIELFADKTPRTCENFRQFCTGQYEGMTYANTPFHRVIEDFMIQGGDITNGDGTGNISIYGSTYDDENLDWRDIDAAGLVCSANSGKNTNASALRDRLGNVYKNADNLRFFITLDEQPHLNGKHTVFGRLVSGQELLQRIGGVAVDEDDQAVQKIVITRSGELERKKKQPKETLPQKQHESINDRGRRRESGDLDDVDTKPQQSPKRDRKQSDNVVDEGLRGRPRKRSKTRRDSNVIEDDQSSTAVSPATMHKRKRSASPDTRPTDQAHNRGYERRRRSLPNQYDESERYGNGRRYKESNRHNGNSRQYNHRDQYHSRHGQHDERDRYDDHRLGSSGYEDAEPAVKFKGRGVMKYREPGRL